MAQDCMLAGKVLGVARLHGDPPLYAGWKGSCIARLYGSPRLYAGCIGSLCSQAIW